MAYDSPNVTVRREWFAGAAGGAATTEYARFRSFQKARLRAVHAIVTTAGTSTDHALNIFHGTDSVGTIALSTNTAGTKASNTAIDLTLASLDQISVKTVADADGVADVVYEYDLYHDAVQSE